jgi:HK97 family phage major capsid protein
MAYNDIIDRNDAAALIPEQVLNQVFDSVPQSSYVMKWGKRLPNMTNKQLRVPVLSALPSAYFVNGDTGLKQTTDVSWQNKYITAEEIAVIVPIPQAVLDDSQYPIWDQVQPWLVDAIGKTVDAAILFGVSAPVSWPQAIVPGAIAAGNSVVIGTGIDLVDDILGGDTAVGVFGRVEADGFMVSGALADVSMKRRLRGLRATTGELLFMNSVQDGGGYILDNSPTEFVTNGSWQSTALMIAGDFKQLVWSVRQDVSFTLLKEAVIQDNTGAIIYNLAQQDMVALRVVFRMGWQLPNPATQLNTVAASRYPFAILTP